MQNVTAKIAILSPSPKSHFIFFIDPSPISLKDDKELHFFFTRLTEVTKFWQNHFYLNLDLLKIIFPFQSWLITEVKMEILKQRSFTGCTNINILRM